MSEKQEKKKRKEDEVPTVDLGAIIDDRVAGMAPHEKDLWLRIMFLLNQSEKYANFVTEHFEIQTAVNDETKEIDLMVIEKPVAEKIQLNSDSFSLDVASQLKASMILKHNGCTNTAQVLKSLIQLITGEDISKPKLVTSATDADISKEVETQKAVSNIIIAK